MKKRNCDNARSLPTFFVELIWAIKEVSMIRIRRIFDETN